MQLALNTTFNERRSFKFRKLVLLQFYLQIAKELLGALAGANKHYLDLHIFFFLFQP